MILSDFSGGMHVILPKDSIIRACSNLFFIRVEAGLVILKQIGDDRLYNYFYLNITRWRYPANAKKNAIARAK
jgi:hypothetical protein